MFTRRCFLGLGVSTIASSLAPIKLPSAQAPPQDPLSDPHNFQSLLKIVRQFIENRNACYDFNFGAPPQLNSLISDPTQRGIEAAQPILKKYAQAVFHALELHHAGRDPKSTEAITQLMLTIGDNQNSPSRGTSLTPHIPERHQNLVRYIINRRQGIKPVDLPSLDLNKILDSLQIGGDSSLDRAKFLNGCDMFVKNELSALIIKSGKDITVPPGFSKTFSLWDKLGNRSTIACRPNTSVPKRSRGSTRAQEKDPSVSHTVTDPQEIIAEGYGLAASLQWSDGVVLPKLPDKVSD